MNGRLIVEGGATKTDWCLLRHGSAPLRFQTEGMNLAHMSQEVLSPIVAKAAREIGPGVDDIHFYAAGLIGTPSLDLTTCFPGARVEYASDLMAAARAVCGHARGIAVILGTGSNSCLFDGTNIVRNVHGGGYIIGDEGGAAALGKQFIADFIKDLVPGDVSDAFRQRYPSDYGSIVQAVYRSEAPAKYFGSLAPLLLEHLHEPYVRNLVLHNFKQFIERAILQYERLPIGVVGGFGNACRALLEEAGAPYGLTWSRFVAAPMDGLITYHAL